MYLREKFWYMSIRKDIIISIEEFKSQTELPDQDADLLSAARENAKKAYAPYSNFQVGAAVLLANGQIITGNNQENAAYPSGLCAERVALFYAQSKYPDVAVKAIAVTAISSKIDISSPIPPCGACRQVLTEYENRHHSPMRVILQGERGSIVTLNSASDLLPLKFDSEFLK